MTLFFFLGLGLLMGSLPAPWQGFSAVVALSLEREEGFF
jgi:hypothetical protein